MFSFNIYKFSVLSAFILLCVNQIRLSRGELILRISGGYRTEQNNLAKYTVSLRRNTAREELYFGSGHYCGGSIISPTFILTASHCLDEESAEDISVVCGTPQRFKRTSDTQVIKVKKFIMHNKYSPTTYINDIGLVQLQTPIVIDNQMTDIIGLTKRELPKDGNYYAAGWGRIYKNGPVPNEILYAKMKLLPKSNDCYYTIEGKIYSTIFCAGDPQDPEIQAYIGDSGGPLICNYKLVGIVSLGPPSIEGASVYTKVSYYIPWIKKYVNLNLKEGVTKSKRKKKKRVVDVKSGGIVQNVTKSTSLCLLTTITMYYPLLWAELKF